MPADTGAEGDLRAELLAMIGKRVYSMLSTAPGPFQPRHSAIDRRLIPRIPAFRDTLMRHSGSCPRATTARGMDESFGGGVSELPIIE